MKREARAVPARETVGLFWSTSFPVTLQDERFAIVDVNDAFCEFSGYPREALIGRDPLWLAPEEDRASLAEHRDRLAAAPGRTDSASAEQGRIVDARGFVRWYRVARQVIEDSDGRPLHVGLLQDTTGEHTAREHADRSVRELDDWFDLSPLGMVLFDGSGLLVRSNPAFDALAGCAPVSLADASPSLAALLAWGEGGRLDRLQPGAQPIESQGWVGGADGTLRPLRAIVRCYRTASGERRYMGIVEDRSAEEERDLAHLQIGALMDTAGVGIATFQESSGWVRQRAVAPASSGAAVLQNISRELVAPESLADYERLQAALKRTERAEVRYAIRHPELGQRWLLTRVEPATLASGQKTASVVTLDITDQRQSQRRSEQLLREMTTILESTTAGIAYLRGGVLVRCNRRFESMLGLSGRGAAGAGIAELLSGLDDAAAMARSIAAALAADATYESEFAYLHAAASGPGATGAPGPTRWYSLSVRRAGASGAADEAIAVLSDITRLKAQQLELAVLARERAEQAERTRSILDSVLVGIVTVGPEGIDWMNRSARRMFGGDVADFAGRPLTTIATDEPDHPLRRSVESEDDAGAGRSEAFECRVRARDGREFRVVGNAVAIGSELTYAFLDVERRRQAEAAMSEAQAALRRIIETAPLAIALVDAKTLALVQLNEVAAHTLGGRREALLGKAPEDVLAPTLAAERRRDMTAALATRDATTREYRFEVDGEERIWDTRYLPLASADGEGPDQLLLVATDVTEQRAAQEARFEAALAQRDMLVKEVHHRIKNNLQGVAGLLQQIATRKPEVAGAIDEVVGQVQAIAQVYGLQVGATGPLAIGVVVEAIAGSVERTFGRTITCRNAGDALDWTLPEAEAIPVALTINELLTNAIKHGDAKDATIECDLVGGADGVEIRVANAGRLPAAVGVARIPSGVSGLGLVRALLPRRGATLAIEQRGARVVATVALLPPGVRRAGDAD